MITSFLLLLLLLLMDGLVVDLKEQSFTYSLSITGEASKPKKWYLGQL